MAEPEELEKIGGDPHNAVQMRPEQGLSTLLPYASMYATVMVHPSHAFCTFLSVWRFGDILKSSHTGLYVQSMARSVGIRWVLVFGEASTALGHPRRQAAVHVGRVCSQ